MANDPKYTAATARADKLLEPDGSVKTASGTVVSGPSASGAAAYSSATARADKLLEPDGSIVTSGSGSGGSTPPGTPLSSVQYNNAGAFGGIAAISTDGTNLICGPYTAAVTQPVTVGTGTNASVVLALPAGTPNNQPITISGGGSSSVPNITSSVTHLAIRAASGAVIQMAYAGGGTPTASFNAQGSLANSFTFAGGLAGSSPTLSTTGSDTNVGVNIKTQGIGAVVIQPSAVMANNNLLQLNRSTGVTAAYISVNEAGNSANFNLGGSAFSGSGSGFSFTSSINTTGGAPVLFAPQIGSTIALAITNVAASVTANYLQVTTNGQPAGDILKCDNTGKTTLKQLILTLANVPVYANNTAATGGGLTAGSLYRTGADPDQLCIVH